MVLNTLLLTTGFLIALSATIAVVWPTPKANPFRL